jgi:hypothetical protein
MFPGAVRSILILRRGHRHWSAAQGPFAESRAAGAEQPALVALIPKAARCAARRGQLRARSLRERAHSCRWLTRLRRKCGPLAEVRVLRFAICHELSIDLWQRLVGSARSGKSTHYRRDASATLHKSCLLARYGTGSLARRSALLSSLLTVGRENDSARLW